MIETAVILGAGLGTRLRGEHDAAPKGFVRLGERPIVEESVELLARAGMTDIVIVTGYAANHYEALAERYRGLVRTVHNAEFANSGSMYSLYCAREAVSGAFLLLESDLVYEPRALTALLDLRSPDAILVAGPSRAGDEVYVSARDNRLTGMSKDAATLQDPVVGELVGIGKISAALFATMQRIATVAFATSLDLDYETDCLVAAAAEQAIVCLLVPDLLWSEIDDASHLRRARAEIYPELQRRRASG